jgi:hypothetical protein
MNIWDRRMEKLRRAYDKVGQSTHTYERGLRLTELTSEHYGRSLAACGISHCLHGKSIGEAKKFIAEQLDQLSKVACAALDFEYKRRGIWHPAKDDEEIVIQEKENESNTD